MTDITPNFAPKGKICGTCRFTTTHTVADGSAKFMVVCRRFPPLRMSALGNIARLEDHHADTAWPVTIWDDWCGEWQARVGAEGAPE